MARKFTDISKFHNEIVERSEIMTVADIARELNLAYQSVKNYMIRNNIKRLITKGYVTTKVKRVHLGSFDSLEEALDRQQEFKELYKYLLAA